MKKYEYKFIAQRIVIGLDYEKKMKNAEAEWNELGRQGWKFCWEGNGCIVFIREYDDMQTNPNE